MIMLSRAVFISIFIIWNLASIIYIDNLGSLRQSLPQNIISWLAIALIISIIAFTVFYRKNRIFITIPAMCFFLALAILSINLFYIKESHNVIFWYWSGISAGVVLYIVGLQIREKWLIQSFCIYCFIAINVIQCLFTIYQYFFETTIFYFATDMRSYGLTQQITILSVNMAMSCMFSLMTLVLSQFKLASLNQEKCRITLLSLCIFLFTVTLVVLQSITTTLSFAVCAFVFICLFYQKNKVRVSASYFIIALAVFIGVYLIQLCPKYIDSEIINRFHLKQMLRFSISLFIYPPAEVWEQPLILNASMEKNQLPFLSSENYIVPHIYNEILRWIMTGGFINLIFMSLLITGGIYVIYQSIIKYKKNGNGYSISLILALTPVVINSNLEHPFLQSVLHWGMIILFLSFSDASFPLKEQSSFYINKHLSLLFSFSTFIIGLSVFIIGLNLFNGQSFFHTNIFSFA
ncbi:O-antigen ligase domain-containing protein [Providencia rettgeri]|uniref:O-antigen ligase domain-containing protein n=1 Tax=Providencia rettgeri TaxID=587 RepID=UPI0015ECCB4F|nr:O-antigen ligase domain-containing protein [Providencia rettgeri]QLR05636.1 O-antigen ligase domain-containing protein [Providencia rettgeri]